jgi:hypothetical protein
MTFIIILGLVFLGYLALEAFANGHWWVAGFVVAVGAFLSMAL